MTTGASPTIRISRFIHSRADDDHEVGLFTASNKFNEMRSALPDTSDFVVQDDSGCRTRCSRSAAAVQLVPLMAARSPPSAVPSRSV
jgi:hypothetical protein